MEMSWRRLGIQVSNVGVRSDLNIQVPESLLQAGSMNEAFRAIIAGYTEETSVEGEEKWVGGGFSKVKRSETLRGAEKENGRGKTRQLWHSESRAKKAFQGE